MARNFASASSQYINLGTPAALQITGKISLAGWFKATSYPSNATIVASGFASGSASWLLDYASGSFRVGTNSTDATAAFSTTGAWHHVGGFNDGANWKLFIDGVLVATTADTVGAKSGFFVGSIGNNSINGSPNFFWNGAIAEVAVWNTNIPPSAFVAMAAGAPPIIAHPDGIRGYWPLLGGSPEPDYSVNRNSGTLTNAPTLVAHPGSTPFLFPGHRATGRRLGFAPTALAVPDIASVTVLHAPKINAVDTPFIPSHTTVYGAVTRGFQRVSQVSAEVLYNNASTKARVTQAAIEVLQHRPGTTTTSVTQLSVEVMRMNLADFIPQIIRIR